MLAKNYAQAEVSYVKIWKTPNLYHCPKIAELFQKFCQRSGERKQINEQLGQDC